MNTEFARPNILFTIFIIATITYLFFKSRQQKLKNTQRKNCNIEKRDIANKTMIMHREIEELEIELIAMEENQKKATNE